MRGVRRSDRMWYNANAIPTKVLVISTLILTIGGPVVLGSQSRPTPRFADYPAASSQRVFGEVVGISRPEETEAEAAFNNRLRKAAKNRPNFAGHYAIIGWSCGMICVNLAIVDTRTGKIYDTPFIGIGDGPCPDSYRATKAKLIEFRTDSRLLVVRGSAEDLRPGNTFEDAPCSARYYVWTKNRLVLVREEFYR